MFCFVSALVELCAKIGIPFAYPEFLMIDACDAEFNAAASVFGSKCNVLTCWFHLLLNIKKPDRKKLIPAERWEEV